MRRKLAALLLSTALLTAAACGSDDGNGNGNGDDGGGDGPDVVELGLIPIVDVAPLFLGDQQGFFADQNIEIAEPDFGAGGAAIIPGVESGQFDFGFSNVISLMLAQEGGIDLRVVSNGNNSTGVDGEDFGSLMVPVDSPVESAAELSEATIGINTLNNIADTVVRASVRNAGGDPSTINFVGVEFPAMLDELAAGNIDAAFPVEPFQTAIREAGVGRSIASSWVDAAPNLTVAVYFTSAELAESNPDLVERFAAAMAESLAYADANPDEVRAILSEYTQIEPETAEALTLPTWPAEINRESTEQLAELALGDGILTQAPDLDALLP
jgi:NitT/TauT family transport system substrate-binding protein